MEIPKDGSVVHCYPTYNDSIVLKKSYYIFWDDGWWDVDTGQSININYIDRWVDNENKWHKVKHGNP